MKSFDTVNRETLWKSVAIQFCQELHNGMEACVAFNGQLCNVLSVDKAE